MELVIAVLIGVLTVIPFLKLLPHFGIHQYWAFAAIIPFGALALIWWMSLRLQDMERN